MGKNAPDEIKTTIERIGRRVSETGEVARTVLVEGVDAEGTIQRTTEVEKGLNDCGHVGATGAVCHVCGAATICEADAKSDKFACSSCGRICCPDCSVESILKPGVRVCRTCGLPGMVRASLRRRG